MTVSRRACNSERAAPGSQLMEILGVGPAWAVRILAITCPPATTAGRPWSHVRAVIAATLLRQLPAAVARPQSRTRMLLANLDGEAPRSRVTGRPSRLDGLSQGR